MSEKINDVYLVILENKHWYREYYVIAHDEVEAVKIVEEKHPSFVGDIRVDLHYMNVNQPGILL